MVSGFTLAMTAQNRFYRPISEQDTQAGYVNIFLCPMLDIYSDMKHSYIVELKYSQSYRHFMQEHLFNQKPFKESFLPRGIKDNAEAEVERYNQILADHPVDLQILGIGRNGHIGFNEPGTAFDSQTHLVDLDQSTIEANARFFDKIEDVPTQAISMGIANILAAKSIILFAYGESKAQAIAGTVNGPKTESLPASALQGHPDVVIIADQAALSLL